MATRQFELEIENLEDRQLLSAAASALAFDPANYCVQYRESDFNFASRLMEEEGIYSSFKHSDSGVPSGSGKVTLWDHCFELPRKHSEGAGEDIFTDKYGRVKVQFHWDRQSTANADSSCWVRVSQIWAGKRWGASFWPRIGQEVIVDFLEGDPDQPIIVGSVYNAEIMPPYEPPANKVVGGLKSNNSLGGEGETNPGWTNPEGKYLTLRPRPADAEFTSAGSGSTAGGSDSIWIDLGAPIMQSSDGRKFKMLVAPLVLDLDNQINVNFHGNAAGER